MSILSSCEKMFEFTILEIGVSTTKDDAVTPTTGKKVMRHASKIAFPSQFGATSIEDLDSEIISVETKHDIDVTIHPNGTIHFETMNASMNALSMLEKWLFKIAILFKRFGSKNLSFDIIFHSHTDIKSKAQLTEISRMFNSLRISSPLKHTQNISTPLYFMARIKPHSPTASMLIGYHPEFVDLSFRLKPLTPDKFKNKYLITPVEELISALTTELG